jgi:hypothetical protein
MCAHAATTTYQTFWEGSHEALTAVLDEAKPLDEAFRRLVDLADLVDTGAGAVPPIALLFAFDATAATAVQALVDGPVEAAAGRLRAMPVLSVESKKGSFEGVRRTPSLFLPIVPISVFVTIVSLTVAHGGVAEGRGSGRRNAHRQARRRLRRGRQALDHRRGAPRTVGRLLGPAGDCRLARAGAAHGGHGHERAGRRVGAIAHACLGTVPLGAPARPGGAREGHRRQWEP